MQDANIETDIKQDDCNTTHIPRVIIKKQRSSVEEIETFTDTCIPRIHRLLGICMDGSRASYKDCMDAQQHKKLA